MKPLPPARLTAGLAAEYEAFAGLLGGTGAAGWRAATRCAGWQVRDVAAHVAGNAADSADGSIGSRTPDQQALSLRDGTPGDVAAALRAAAARLGPFLRRLPASAWDAPSPVPGRSIASGVLTLWYDTYVHGDDIRAALGLPPLRGPGLAASVHWLGAELTRLGRGPVTLSLTGFGTLGIGSGGPVVACDAHDFVLAASGRLDPGPLGLTGTGNVYSLP